MASSGHLHPLYKPSTKQQKNKQWARIKDDYAWKADVDYRLFPEQYRVGKGEQGVLICEPYKSEILPHWRFKNPEIAQISSAKIYALFERYLLEDDFVGTDMARKFLQMGYTRARRYANHASGRKYDSQTGVELSRKEIDPIKSQSALIFYKKWQAAEKNLKYKHLKSLWKKKYG